MAQETGSGSPLVAGAAAGLLATVPMTLFMEALHQQLPPHERYPLPPSEVVAQLTEAAGAREHVEPPEHRALTMIAHFGYGAAAGALYGPIARELRPPPVRGGIAFGLAVWSASYLGLLPALGILRPATEHPARRTALMIGAHLVWGAVLGLAAEQLGQEGQTEQHSEPTVWSAPGDA